MSTPGHTGLRIAYGRYSILIGKGKVRNSIMGREPPWSSRANVKKWDPRNLHTPESKERCVGDRHYTQHEYHHHLAILHLQQISVVDHSPRSLYNPQHYRQLVHVIHLQLGLMCTGLMPLCLQGPPCLYGRIHPHTHTGCHTGKSSQADPRLSSFRRLPTDITCHLDQWLPALVC